VNITVLPHHPTHLTRHQQTFSCFPNRNALWKDDDFRWFRRLQTIHRWSYVWSRKRRN
jgi:hypothetical protein